MSTHAIPANIQLERLTHLLRQYLRESTVTFGGDTLNKPATLEFIPDLSAAEIVVLDKIVGLVGREELSPNEEQVIRDERATLAAYLNNASPTAAQTVTALKSLIRVVRALAKE